MKSFNKSKNNLSKEEKDKLKYKFNQLLIVGTELETQNKNREARDKLKEILSPTENYYAVPDNLVVDIKTDGSLHTNGNVEVIMIGANQSFEDMRDKYEYVEDEMRKLDFYADYECGQHISLLTLKPIRVPGIIYRNIFQLSKYYAPELLRLVSVGSDEDYKTSNIIRRNAKTYANWNYNNLTASSKSMSEFITLLNKCNPHEGKYGFMAFHKTAMIPDSEDIGELFVEYRIPDRCMIPSISTAWNFLIKAIALKAITISQSGILTFSDEDWAKKKELIDSVFNLSCEKIEENLEFKESTLEFLEFLKPEFEYMNALKAYDILVWLTENPLWGKNIMVLSPERIKELEKAEKGTEFLGAEEFYIRKNITKDVEEVKITETNQKINDELLLGVKADDDESLINYLAEKIGVQSKTIKSYFDEYDKSKIIKTKKSYYLRE